jgi:hypothetical protein
MFQSKLLEIRLDTYLQWLEVCSKGVKTNVFGVGAAETCRERQHRKP